MMLMPRRSFDLLDEIFEDNIFTNQTKIMKTDIKENEKNYIVEVDLPGYSKEDIKISVENGYLTVSAEINKQNNSEEEKYLRKERYYGQCQRSFYIGESIENEDIKAKFKNGILTLEVPKANKKELPPTKYIPIED